MKSIHVVLIAALVFNAVANILIKEGMKGKSIALSSVEEIFRSIALNPIVVSGIFFFGLALVAYSYVLTQLKLSVAYPIMTSAGFLIVVTYSFVKLQEQITMIQLCGMALILAGVWMVASNLG